MPEDNPFQIVFSLPNSNEMYLFEEGIGEEQFHFQYFDNQKVTLVFKGVHRNISLSDAMNIVSGWKLSNHDDSELGTIYQYESLVAKGIESIKKEEFQKVVLAAKEIQASETRVEALFNSLIKEHSNAFVYALIHEGFCMLGASPETLLKRQSGVLYTEALGGTLTEEGKYSEKEVIEHQQIQFELEDTFKRMGYQFKASETTVKQAGQVSHLRTHYKLVSKGLGEDLNLRDAMHPTPAVCGLPREKAKRFIDNFENFDRKYYAGFLGPVFSNGDFYSMVNLRCTEAYHSCYVLYAGAGVNAMSVAKDELLEIKRKLKTIADHLK